MHTRAHISHTQTQAQTQAQRRHTYVYIIKCTAEEEECWVKKQFQYAVIFVLQDVLCGLWVSIIQFVEVTTLNTKCWISAANTQHHKQAAEIVQHFPHHVELSLSYVPT